MHKEEETGSGSAELLAEPELGFGQARARSIPDLDPYAHHLSDRQHFRQSTDPQERKRGLGVYVSPGSIFNDDGA